MWYVPLQTTVTNLNKVTLLLDGPTGIDLLNSAYTVPSSERTLDHIMTCCKDRPGPVVSINNVYNLPSIKPAIHYLHGAAGFPTEATQLKAICNGH